MTETVPDVLARIVAHKRTQPAAGLSVRREWEQQAETARAGRRDFRQALMARTPAVIAEIKKASPSKGLLAADFDPVRLAREYETGGAAALSVLTDEAFFQGSLSDLRVARMACARPVMRKDFTLDESDVLEAAANGADAILLIAAILTAGEIRTLAAAAAGFDMAALVEVHDEIDLAKALEAGAEIIGVNNRNLTTFEVTLETSLRLAEHIPAGVLKVSESGIHSAQDIGRLRAAGYQAFLVGEHLMKSPDPAQALRPGGCMMVKICGITNREDALAAIDGGAAALGFNFYPASPRYITPDDAAAIIEGLPAVVWKAGVFVDESAESVLRIAQQAGLDIAQLHGNEAPEQFPRGIRVWKAIRMLEADPGQARSPVPQSSGVEAVLLDGPASGQRFDWTLIPEGIERLILAGGLDAENVAAAIEQVRPWGVDVSSRIEISPGRKDHIKMAAFLKAALAASQ